MHQRGHAPPLASARRFTGRPISDPSGKCWDPRPDDRHDKLQQLTPQPRSLGERPPGIQTREVLAGKLRDPRLVRLLSFLCWSKVCIIFHIEDPPPPPAHSLSQLESSVTNRIFINWELSNSILNSFCRNCIGQNFAVSEEKTVLATLLQRWEDEFRSESSLLDINFEIDLFSLLFSLLLSRFTFSVDKTHTVEKQISAVTRARYGIKLFAQPRQSA